MIIDQNTRQQQLNDPYMKALEGMSPEELQMFKSQLLAKKRNSGSMASAAVGPLANTLAQIGGIKPYEQPEAKGMGGEDLNTFMMKEMIKRKLDEQDPLNQLKLKEAQAKAVNDNLTTLPQNAMPEDKDAFLKQLSPHDAALVKSIVNYDYDIFRGLSFKDRERIGGLATMYDPTFSMADFNARQNYKNEFAKGKIGANIRSYNTVLGHLGSLNDAAQNKNLPSSPIRLFEQGQRGFATQFAGSSASKLAMADEDNAITAVSGELANVFKNSGGTDQEIEKWFKSYDKNATREYKQQWIKQGLDLIQSRMGAIGYDYERVMGKPYDKSLVSPKAEEVIKKISVGQNIPTNAGQISSPQTQQEYDALPKGSIYMDTDGQQKRKK